jgi:hypothetical protein
MNRRLKDSADSGSLPEHPISGVLKPLLVSNGASPSGKAQGFGPCIRRFESSRPSHILNGLLNTDEVNLDC